MAEAPITRATLLARLKDGRDADAWREFARLYGPVVYSFARNRGLQDADAADLMQEVLRSVARNAGRMEYDPARGTFRGWLYTVTRNKVYNFLSAQKNKAKGVGDSAAVERLDAVPDHREDPDATWDLEYQRRLSARAMDRVKGEFQANTWKAFWQTAVEGKGAGDVGKTLKMTAGAVYVAKSRVLARLRDEVQKMEAEAERGNAFDSSSDEPGAKATGGTEMKSSSKSDCPTDGELKELLAEGNSSTRCEAVTGHVGECDTCQSRIEALATGGDAHLSKCVRGLDRLDPPSGSAYWEALDGAEKALTATLAPDDTDTTPKPREEIKLDFLRPAETPGRLGRLGHFEVVRVIGRGGMGVVLHAFDADLERDVAVKLLDPQLAGNETARARFCREARAAAAVTHENIVAVHQVDEDDVSGLPYLVMQLVTGESLEARLARGRLTVAEALRIGSQAAAGLAAAHAAGLIHRDIKPGNILLEAGTDKARLTDFGLARATEDIKLTRTGFVAGTPLYMAPEQARGDEIDHRADLFALGSVLYEAVAGKPPFGGKTPLQVLRRIADERHEPLHKVNPDVPDWFADLIDRLLTKDVSKRIQTAAEVSATLAEHVPCAEAEASAECGPPECGPAKVVSKIVRRRVRSRTAIGLILGSMVAAGLLIGGVGGWFLGPKSEQIVEKDKLVTVHDLAGSPDARDLGPKPAFTLPGQNGGILALAVSKDGSHVLTGGEDGVVRIWDTGLKKVLNSLTGHAGPVWAVDFVGDGFAVSAGDDSRVFFWDLVKKEPAKTLPHSGSVRAAAVSPKGTVLVTGDRTGTVWLWDLVKDGPPIFLDTGATVNAIAFTPDGSNFATAWVNGKVSLWNVEARDRDTPRIALDGHKGPVYGVAFSSDGKLAATGGWDRHVIIWDVNSGKQLKKIDEFGDGVTSVAFTPCCRYLAAGGMDGTVAIYDLAGKDSDPPILLTRYARDRGAVTALRFSGDGSFLVTAGRDGMVYGWTVEHAATKGE